MSSKTITVRSSAFVPTANRAKRPCHSKPVVLAAVVLVAAVVVVVVVVVIVIVAVVVAAIVFTWGVHIQVDRAAISDVEDLSRPAHPHGDQGRQVRIEKHILPARVRADCLGSLIDCVSLLPLPLVALRVGVRACFPEPAVLGLLLLLLLLLLMLLLLLLLLLLSLLLLLLMLLSSFLQ